MSKSRRLDKDILSKSIDAVLSIDDHDLVNNVVDILVGCNDDGGYEHYESKPMPIRRKKWSIAQYLTNVTEMARRMVERLFPVPKPPRSFYADIW